MLGKRKIRKNVFGLVFGYEFNKGTDYKQYYTDAYDNFCCDDDENESVKTAFFGICENIEVIDDIISKNLKGWAISRISNVSLSILRLSVYEMKYSDLPHPISINEAVELAKEYGEDGSASYINGVLNSISKNALSE